MSVGVKPSGPSKLHWKRDIAILICVEVAFLSGFLLWVGQPGSDGSACNLRCVIIDSVMLGDNGRATFFLQNQGIFSDSILQAKVNGTNTHGAVLVNLSSGNAVPAKGFLNLTVVFQGIAWELGGHYQFTLTDSQGHQYLYSLIAEFVSPFG